MSSFPAPGIGAVCQLSRQDPHGSTAAGIALRREHGSFGNHPPRGSVYRSDEGGLSSEE